MANRHRGAARVRCRDRGSVQRYRSWCDGVIVVRSGDITNDWECAAVAGQTAAAADMYEHHLSSLAFLFGKK